MVKYYAYYSFGGYRELYLGNSDDSFDQSWYFSMLSVWESRLKDKEDDVLRARVDEARALPKIVDVGKGGENAIPDEASTLIVFGGYDVIYRTVGQYQVLAVKDIDSKDDTGRPAPFMMLFVAQDATGIAVLDKLSDYLISNLKAFKDYLSGLFVYDLEKNGLRFGVQSMNGILKKVCEEVVQPRREWHSFNVVHLLIAGQNLDVALQNQKISKKDVFCAQDLHGNQLIGITNIDKNSEEEPVAVEDVVEPTRLAAACETQADKSAAESKDNMWKCLCGIFSKCRETVKRLWDMLPEPMKKTVRYIILFFLFILVILAILPRSCQSKDKKYNQSSEIVRYETVLRS